mmetsp:Transcript_27127/g.49259  ORF Transcript_27127/g.49259 Transcript_27127/m.49259 type:complete len:381 (-) Transcript_27127:83-1225(-)
MNKNQERDVQKRLAVLVGDDLPTSIDSEEFNLHKNYHSAIECLLHCEQIISNLQEELISKDDQIANLENILQEQVVSKDDHIAALENKLVHMSLELASAKSLVDEHQLFKRRLSETNEKDRLTQFIDEFRPSNSNATHRWNSRAGSISSPALTTSFRDPTRKKPKNHSCLGNSWSWSRSDSEIVVSAIVNSSGQDNVSSSSVPQAQAMGTISGRNVPATLETPKPLCGFMSWVFTENSTHENSATFNNDAATKGGSRSTSLGECPKRRLATSRPPKKQSSLSLTHASLSNTSRRFSNFGQRCFGLKGNDNSEPNAVEEFRRENNQSSRLPRKNSASSSRSCISGVVFPISSADCLRGCANDFESRRNRTSSTVNEEWPSF